MQRDFPGNCQSCPHCAERRDVSPIRRQNSKTGGLLIWADEHFLEIFDFPLLAKSTNTLVAANELIIARSVADQYFPGAKGDYQEVLGQGGFCEHGA